MAEQIDSTAAPLEIAVLRDKERNKIQYHNLMLPGTGTPWEQRGGPQTGRKSSSRKIRCLAGMAIEWGE